MYVIDKTIFLLKLHAQTDLMDILKKRCEAREWRVKKFIKNVRDVPRKLKSEAFKTEGTKEKLEAEKFGPIHPKTDVLVRELLDIEKRSERLRKSLKQKDQDIKHTGGDKRTPVTKASFEKWKADNKAREQKELTEIASQVWQQVKTKGGETRIHSIQSELGSLDSFRLAEA